jgi:hypothetical protein
MKVRAHSSCVSLDDSKLHKLAKYKKGKSRLHEGNKINNVYWKNAVEDVSVVDRTTFHLVEYVPEMNHRRHLKIDPSFRYRYND